MMASHLSTLSNRVISKFLTAYGYKLGVFKANISFSCNKRVFIESSFVLQVHLLLILHQFIKGTNNKELWKLWLRNNPKQTVPTKLIVWCLLVWLTSESFQWENLNRIQQICYYIRMHSEKIVYAVSAPSKTVLHEIPTSFVFCRKSCMPHNFAC